MNSNELISIIIPTYNRKNDLIRAVNSVTSQSYTNWELIIVDNNSVDGTKDYIYSLNNHKIKFLLVNNNGLIAYSRNKGIESSKGEYVAFLDSDDWWHNDKLIHSINYLEKGYDLVYHDLFIVKSENKILKFKTTNSKDSSLDVYEDLISSGNYICNSSVVVRKSILILIQKLPESKELNSICDFQAWIEISKITNKFKKIPKILGYYWFGGGNYTTPNRTINSLNEFEAIYLNKIHPKPFWYNYAMARAHFVLKNKTKSREFLRNISIFNKNPFIMLKVIYMKLLIS